VSNQPSEGASDLRSTRRRRQTADAPNIDRLPPSSPECEQCLLGCCLLDNAAIGRVIEAFKGQDDFLYDLRNQTIWETMEAMYSDREAVDTVTLCERLMAFGLIDQVGGMSYISTLPDAPPSAANLDFYIEIVRDKALRRKMIRAAADVVTRMYDGEGEDLDVLLDGAERDLLRVRESRLRQSEVTIRTFVTQAMAELEASRLNKGKISGIATGFVDFDQMTDGMHPAEMIVIAARPSLGKTSVAMNIAERVAIIDTIPTAIFSLEMTGTSLSKRMVSSLSRVSVRSIRDGTCTKEDYQRLTSAAAQVMGAPLYIDETGGISILELRAKARRLFQKYGIKLFIIDYVGLLLAAAGRKYDSRQQEVAEISTGIKNLAKELNVPIITLSQLNREIERDKNRRPKLADLRDSGQLENDADVVSFLYKPRKKGEEEEDDSAKELIPVNWLVAKQRNGRTGDVRLLFRRSITRFESAVKESKIADEDVPESEARQQKMPMADP